MSSRPYLMSTAASLRRFGISDYNGFDFSTRCRNRRKMTPEKIRRLLLTYLHNVIIPNAMLSKKATTQVDPNELVKEIRKAVDYSMTLGRDRVDREAFKLFKEDAAKDGWWDKNVRRPVYYYVLDRSYCKRKGCFAKDKMARSRRWTVERYAKDRIPKRLLKLYAHPGTPALNELVEAYRKDASVADYTTAEFKERFGCSNRTIQKFKAFIRERTERNTLGLSISERRTRKAKDAAGTEGTERPFAGIA